MCWVCPVDFDDRREILSLSLKTVVVHNSVKSLKKIFCPTRSPEDRSYRERHLRFLFKLLSLLSGVPSTPSLLKCY